MFRDSFHIEPPSNEMNCDYDYLEVRLLYLVLYCMYCTRTLLSFCPDAVVFNNEKSLDFKEI